jgi:predicted MFS family arabinose efflux permease
VAQQIVPFAAELAEPSRRGATIGIVMRGLLCGILFGRALAGAVGDHYGWRAMFRLGLLLAVAVGLLLAAVLPRSRPKTQEGYGALLKFLAILCREEPELRRATMIQGCLFGSFSALWSKGRILPRFDRRGKSGNDLSVPVVFLRSGSEAQPWDRSYSD